MRCKQIGGGYSVEIELTCVKNLIFSRYDLDVYIDDRKVDTFDHGTSTTLSLELEEGIHTLLVTERDNPSVDGKLQFSVPSESTLSFKISCTEDQVEIKPVLPDEGKAISEVREGADEGKASLPVFEPGSAEAVLNETFPVERALRAVVVAMTNMSATDVFTEDGAAYDPARFHSFSDTAGFYLAVDSAGTWSAQEDGTWRADDVLLQMVGDGGGAFAKVSANIAFDGASYLISGGTRTVGSLENIDSGNTDLLTVDTLELGDNSPYLSVDQSLVEEDRLSDTAKVEAEEASAPTETQAIDPRQEWLESLFSWWDGSCDALEDLVIDHLNDEKSYKHNETTFVDVYDETRQAAVNETLASQGFDQRVEVGDVFIMMEFSADNVFGGTVKNTALGIASYANDTVTLVGIL